MRMFVGIDLGKEPVPDETTICKFRHPDGKTIWVVSYFASLMCIWKKMV